MKLARTLILLAHASVGKGQAWGQEGRSIGAEIAQRAMHLELLKLAI